MPSKYRQPLCPLTFYHIFNRGINGEKIFYSSEDYSRFLSDYETKLSDYVDTFSYCLIPNHFHFLIRTGDDCKAISNQFKLFFSNHSMKINESQNRYGSLLTKPYKRNPVVDERYLQRMFFYIHNNPLHHCICDDPLFYQWSSYETLMSNKNTFLKREEALSYFGGKSGFRNFHNELSSLTLREKGVMEF